jgi:hypothetical protein
MDANSEGYGRKRRWRMLRWFPGRRLYDSRAIKKNLNQGRRCANPAAPKYKSKALTLEPVSLLKAIQTAYVYMHV